jgi:choline dehydrogenase-like flavoprotein
MIIDARSIPPGTAMECEICIVGAGAAGITLAREFGNAPFRVVLLESGGMEFEPETQQLYEGQSIRAPFQDLTSSRLRFFGGTTNHWGGWCLPLDAIDFERRDGFPHHGWPFGKSYLDPWYQRAQEVCRLGPYDYRPRSWGISGKKVPRPFAGPHFEPKILQVSAVRFGPDYAAELRRAPKVSVYLYANAFHLDAGENNADVRQLAVKTLSGNEFTVRARFYVLAAGGIENARLLLASGRPDGNGLGNTHDLVGRFLIVHLVYSGGIIVPSDPHMDFDFRTGSAYAGLGGRHSFVSFIGLSEASMRELRLANAKISWGYQFAPVVSGVKALKRLITGEGPGGSLLSDLAEVIRNLDGVTSYAVRKGLFGEGIPIEALIVGCSSEQQPNPQSRVMLGSERDRIGMPKVIIDWRLTDNDKRMARTTLNLLGAEVGAAGFGRLRSSLASDDAWPDDFYGDEHHMGTTRMHRDPALGVIDANCRVHSVGNLYVAGSSAFPNGTANNTTLTIVALALRLADYLKKQLI